MSLNYEDILEDEKPRFNYAIPPKEYQYPTSWSGNRSKLNDPNVYEYKNINGETCFFIERKEINGDKKFIPYSYDLDKSIWVQKSWPENRPLYREQYLKNNTKPILIVEGEKCVKFCEQHPYIKENYLPMTWSGGGYAVSKTNYQHLEDRQIVLWPDNDDPGRYAMHEVAFNLIKKGIVKKDIKIVHLNSKLLFPVGWDVADPFPKGYCVEDFLRPGQILVKTYDKNDHKKIWERLEQKEVEREINKLQSDIIKKYVYISERDDFRDIEQNTYMDLKRMDHWHLSITKKGEVMSKRLLKNPKLKKAHKAICHAGLDRGVLKIDNQFSEVPPGIYLNNYIKPNVISKAGDVSIITNYYEWLFEKNNWTIIAKFIHVLIKHGGRKINWVPVMISATEGAGKGLLTSTIKSMLGYSNVLTNVSVEQLVEKHSTFVEGAQLICLNELSFSGYKADKREVSNRLKSIFADPFIAINPKNKPAYEIPNICNFFVSSNDERCLHLDQSTRRYFIVNIKHDKEQITKKLNNSNVLKTILETAKGGELLPCLLHYFENIELEDWEKFIERAPDSIDTQEMIESSKDDIHRFLDHIWATETLIFDQNDHKFSGMINTWHLARELRVLNTSDTGNKGIVPRFTDHLLENWLKSKCTKWLNNKNWTRPIKTSTGKRINVWLLVDKEVAGKHLSEMTENELGIIWGATSKWWYSDQEKEQFKKDFANGKPIKENLEQTKVKLPF